MSHRRSQSRNGYEGRARRAQDLLQQHNVVARQAMVESQERGRKARSDAQAHQRAYHDLRVAAIQVVGQQSQAIGQAQQHIATRTRSD